MVMATMRRCKPRPPSRHGHTFPYLRLGSRRQPSEAISTVRSTMLASSDIKLRSHHSPCRARPGLMDQQGYIFGPPMRFGCPNMQVAGTGHCWRGVATRELERMHPKARLADDLGPQCTNKTRLSAGRLALYFAAVLPFFPVAGRFPLYLSPPRQMRVTVLDGIGISLQPRASAASYHSSRRKRDRSDLAVRGYKNIEASHGTIFARTSKDSDASSRCTGAAWSCCEASKQQTTWAITGAAASVRPGRNSTSAPPLCIR